MGEIQIHTNFTNAIAETLVFRLPDLNAFKVRQKLVGFLRSGAEEAEDHPRERDGDGGRGFGRHRGDAERPG